MATRIHDCFFCANGHKIVEILALLTTKLPSSKVYKVGMLFSIEWTLISCKFQHEALRELLLNVH